MYLRKLHLLRYLTLTVFLFELALPVFTSGVSLYLEFFQETHVNVPHHQSVYPLLAWEESNGNEEERDEREFFIGSNQCFIQEFSFIHFTHWTQAISIAGSIAPSTIFPRLFQMLCKLII